MLSIDNLHEIINAQNFTTHDFSIDMPSLFERLNINDIQLIMAYAASEKNEKLVRSIGDFSIKNHTVNSLLEYCKLNIFASYVLYSRQDSRIGEYLIKLNIQSGICPDVKMHTTDKIGTPMMRSLLSFIGEMKEENDNDRIIQFNLINFLKFNGATSLPPLTKNGEDTCAAAKEHLFFKTKMLLLSKSDLKSNFSVCPPEIIFEIFKQYIEVEKQA